MKKLFVLMCGLLLVTGLAQGQTTIQCLGTESGGPGGSINCGALDYVYRVTPGLNDTIVIVAIGTDDPDISNYTNVCAPAGWTMTIPWEQILAHRSEKTPHGVVGGVPTGQCRYMIRWYGPPMTGIFELGFDHMTSSHDVQWATTESAGGGDEADPTEPVGSGLGFVHAPVLPVPTVSHWGIIAILLLLLAAGTVFIVRKRRAEA